MMNRKIIIIVLSLILIAAMAGGIYYWRQMKNKPLDESGARPDVSKEALSAEHALSQYYENSDLGFGFFYPKDFTIKELKDGPNYTVLAENGTSRQNFQFFVEPFDEAGPVTAARIKKDLPGAVVENPEAVLIGPDKNINALIFYGQDASMGRTREIWFVKRDHLFQVTLFPDQDNFIGTILNTFRMTDE